MHLSTILTVLLATPCLASPLASLANPLAISRRDGAPSPQASDIIAAIMPTSTSCSSASGNFASDCRTASQAAEPLITAMVTYNLKSAGQIAAVLALVGFESVDLKYKHNVSPGRPGQGTSAMLMPDNVAKYAASIPELGSAVAAAGGDVAKVLELVVDDKYTFGAAAWWLTSQCKPEVVEGLKDATDAAWAAYMGCVGVDATDANRLQYWARAKKAFGLA
jgi:hypothetical protein